MAGRSQVRKVENYAVDSSGRSKPRVTAIPTVAGTNTIGQVQTGTNATFTGNATITVARSWTRNGVTIAGQTAATYTLVAGDSGKRIAFVNTARNHLGETVVSSVGRVAP